MTPDPSKQDGAALRVYEGYRYTVVTMINGAQPHTEEAELWWQRLTDAERKWHYFRRYVAAHAGEAAQRVDADFREWVEGQLAAESR